MIGRSSSMNVVAMISRKRQVEREMRVRSAQAAEQRETETNENTKVFHDFPDDQQSFPRRRVFIP